MNNFNRTGATLALVAGTIAPAMPAEAATDTASKFSATCLEALGCGAPSAGNDVALIPKPRRNVPGPLGETCVNTVFGTGVGEGLDPGEEYAINFSDGTGFNGALNPTSTTQRSRLVCSTDPAGVLFQKLSSGKVHDYMVSGDSTAVFKTAELSQR